VFLPSDLRRVVDSQARYVNLAPWNYRDADWLSPGEALEGLIVTESGCNPRARRYEPHQDREGRRDAPSDADTAGSDDGEMEDDASYGLCQVMGTNVRVLCGVPPGTPMQFGWLFLPLINIALGLRILLGELRAVRAEVERGEIDPGQDFERALCRYNGGPTGDDLCGGDYRLRAYVDKVARNAQAVRENKRAMNWK
jgi:hypothetical protein